MKNSFRKGSDARLPGCAHGASSAIAKRIFVGPLSLAIAFCACPSYAHTDDGFLIGEWASSDGSATLSFRNDGAYTCNLGFFSETGAWGIRSFDGDTMTIKMGGSIILSLMSLGHDAIHEDYHFEVLEWEILNMQRHISRQPARSTCCLKPMFLCLIADWAQARFGFIASKMQ